MNTRFMSVLLSLITMFVMVMSSFSTIGSGVVDSKSTFVIVPANVVSYDCDSPDGLDVAVYGGLPVSHDDIIDRHCVAPRTVGTMTHKAVASMPVLPIVVTTTPIVVVDTSSTTTTDVVVVDSDVVVDTTDVVVIVDTTPEPTPEPEQEPATEEDACKNKNSGKDGTPEECNAGIGQEKHNN